MCTLKSDIYLYQTEDELQNDPQISKLGGPMLLEMAHDLIKQKGIYAQYDFFDALEEFFQKPIKQSLESDDLVVKIFALIDRRVRKRTLLKLRDQIKDEHEKVKYFYQLRCDAEGINHEQSMLK